MKEHKNNSSIKKLPSEGTPRRKKENTDNNRKLTRRRVSETDTEREDKYSSRYRRGHW